MSRFGFGKGRRGARGASPRRRSILLWGEIGSGKSGFIGALRSEGTKTVGDRWALDLDDASPDVVAYADSSSANSESLCWRPRTSSSCRHYLKGH